MTRNELRPYGKPDDLVAKFGRWEKDLTAHWSAWLTETKDAYDLVSGKQWDLDVIEQLDALLRPHVTFNRVGPVIDAVSGAEIQGRQQVTYLPRQVGASAANEVLTKGAEWIRDRCDAEHEESDAARDVFICGMGCVETRIEYEVDPNGEIMVERIDPLEILPDPASRKSNCVDARYLRRQKRYSLEEFEELFPGEDPEGDDDPAGKRAAIVDPATRYTHGMEGEDEDGDIVIVNEWQWFERQPYYRVAHPDTGETVEVEPEDYEGIDEQAKASGIELGGVRQFRRAYFKAFECSGRILGEVQPIEVSDFTYTFMTGKRDRNEGCWYGLVRPMKDPQKFQNKFFSQILHILNSNAKGGLVMEKGASVDIRSFEDSWAKPDEITWVEDGALSGPGGPKWAPKNAPAYPQGQDRMMQACMEAIHDTTGINEEILGLANRDQPGVLESQRKQAAYGILSVFFDSFKRARKIGGRKLVKFMQKFLSPNTLVRIVGDDGTAQYVPMALQDDTMEYDVIVDDAPAGPNQKQQTWQMIVQLLPILQNANLPPEVWVEFVKYSPFPSALTEKLVQALTQMQQAASQPSPMAQLEMGQKQADIQETTAQAAHHTAQAQRLQVESQAIASGQPDPVHPSTQNTNDAAAALDRAKITGILAKAVKDYAEASQPPLTSPA